jgi:glycosyltransferase involved in cell wall biosynthesis
MVESPQGEPTSIPWFVWPADCKVHVVAANVFEQDAVGNFTFSVYKLLRGNGIPCQLYAGNFDPVLRPTVRHVSDLLTSAEASDLVFFNFSIHDPYMRQISKLPCKKILYFHNITPPRFFQIYDAEHAAHCMEAVGQLDLLRSFEGVIANSVSSGRVLQNLTARKRPSREPGGQEETGHGRGPFEEASRLLEQAARIIEQQEEPKLDVKVCPPFMNSNRWLEIAAEPAPLPPEKTLLLYVGRVAPHKRIEDLLSLYRAYHKLDADSALLIVGGASFDGYSGYLRYLMQSEFKDLRRHIHFHESVSDGQLKTLYPSASAFVTMSEHEGFCVPLVESMVFDTPVFAYASEAVAETLGRAGRLFYKKDFATIAADIHDVLKTDWKRKRVIDEQRRRLAEIVTTIDGATVWSTIEEIFFRCREPQSSGLGRI